MTTKIIRHAGWVVVLALLWPWGGSAGSGQLTLSRRLLGPVAALVADAEWVRFDWYAREGRYERAYASAERALALDPGATQGWSTLASHLVFSRASLENEPDRERRRRWIEAGLQVLERGRGLAAAPAELAHMQGLVLAYVSDVELTAPGVALGWPGGAEGAREAAAAAFHTAGELGKLDGFLMEGALRLRSRAAAEDR